ncbi:MAG TPA: P-loop NTPase, partial [Acidimicrobiales bacterium]
MEPGEYLKAVRRRWPVVGAAVALAAVLGWLTAPASVPKAQYKATAVVSVRTGAGQGAALPLDPVTADIVAAQATSNEVATRAKDKLGLAVPPATLAAQVEATTKGNSVSISATRSSADSAVKVANAFADGLLSFVQQRQDDQVTAAIDSINKQQKDLDARGASIDRRIVASTNPAEQASLRNQRNAIARDTSLNLARLQQLNDFRGPGTSRVTLVTDASLKKVTQPLAPPSSSTVRAVIASGIGLILGLGLALFLDRLDPTIRTKKQAEAAFGLPVVAEIPRTRNGNDQVVVAVQPRSEIAESYRSLRTATMFVPVSENGDGSRGSNGSPRPFREGPEGGVPVGSFSEAFGPSAGGAGRLIVVTSPGPGEGKTASAVNLAAAFAETGRTTLVVGADLRRPGVARYLGLDETPGITDVLGHAAGTTPPRVIRRTSIPGLLVLTSGSAVDNPAGMLARERDLIMKCRNAAEIVIIDTPPLLVANDAVELILASDAVMLVGRAGRTTTDAARRATELLNRLKAPVVGVAMIGVTAAPRSYARYYRSSARASDAISKADSEPATLAEVSPQLANSEWASAPLATSEPADPALVAVTPRAEASVGERAKSKPRSAKPQQAPKGPNAKAVKPKAVRARPANPKAASDNSDPSSAKRQAPTPEAPAPEAPAPEPPTPEASAPEASAPGAPTPGAPTPEAPTSEAPTPELAAPEPAAPEPAEAEPAKPLRETLEPADESSAYNP